jgi:hypothetical protein
MEVVQYLLMLRRNQFAKFNTGSQVMITTIDDSSNVRQNTTINQDYMVVVMVVGGGIK